MPQPPHWPEEISDPAAVIAWSALIIDSYRRLLGRDLVETGGDAQSLAWRLYCAPLAVVSHGREPDPILNYGNHAALALWETGWSDLTRMPSRLTAEPAGLGERRAAFARVAEHGFVENYAGMRISTRGRRFRIQDTVIWTLVDAGGAVHGHAAAIARWTRVG
ncbi:MAG: MEKHLA domain-containing protein [Gammaproteobacteria bacterium]